MSETENKTQSEEPKISKLPIWVAVFGLVVFLAWLLKSTHRETPHYRMICGTKLSGLGKAMLIYANDFDDKYPTAEKWCDLLIACIEASPKQLVCKGSDAKIGESSYAFNENLIGKKPTEVPPDVVVLFETNFGKNPAGRQGLLKDRGFYKFFGEDIWSFGKKTSGLEKVYELRWNQIGGPEILTTENHEGKGCNVLFNDYHVEFVRPERLGELKWEVEEKEK